MPETPLRITLLHYPRWTRCSCGHAAPEHNELLPSGNHRCDFAGPASSCSEPGCRHESHECGCTGYDGALVWADTRVLLSPEERAAWEATLNLRPTSVISKPPAAPVRFAWED